MWMLPNYFFPIFRIHRQLRRLLNGNGSSIWLSDQTLQNLQNALYTCSIVSDRWVEILLLFELSFQITHLLAISINKTFCISDLVKQLINSVIKMEKSIVLILTSKSGKLPIQNEVCSRISVSKKDEKKLSTQKAKYAQKAHKKLFSYSCLGFKIIDQTGAVT